MARMKTWAKAGAVLLFCLLFATAAFAGGAGEKAGGKGFVVGLSNGSFTHSWRVQMIESLQQQFEVYRDRGWASKLIIQNAGEDVNTQIAQIRNLVASKVNLLLVNPLSGSALNPVIKEAQAAGVLVIVYDQPVEDPPCLNLWMNQEYWMAPVTEWLAKAINYKGNIVYVSGIGDQPGNVARDKMAAQVLAKYPNIHMLAKAYGRSDPALAQQVMTDMLASFPNIDGVLTQDGMPLGIIRAFEAAGRPLPPIPGETQIAFIKEWKKRKDATGFTTFAVDNSPGAVNTSLGVGLRLLQGKKLKPEVFSPVKNTIWLKPVLIVDNSNIDKVYEQYKDWADSYYVNAWYSEDQIDAMFQ